MEQIAESDCPLEHGETDGDSEIGSATGSHRGGNKTLLGIKLYEVGRLSLGQAAGFGGHSERAFIVSLGRYGLSVFAYSPGWLGEEVGA